MLYSDLHIKLLKNIKEYQIQLNLFLNIFGYPLIDLLKNNDNNMILTKNKIKHRNKVRESFNKYGIFKNSAIYTIYIVEEIYDILDSMLEELIIILSDTNTKQEEKKRHMQKHKNIFKIIYLKKIIN